MNTSFFGELLQAISERGRSLLDRARARERRDTLTETTENLADLCEELLSNRGEASGVALAREILARYDDLTIGPRIAFFEALATRFGADHTRINAAIEAWRNKPSDVAAAELHAATEPRRLELLRRLNLAPQATRTLVEMRGQLLDTLTRRDDLAAVDADFAYLFSTWFNRGFLVLRRIDWSTPAVILEKIIRYEAVHQIRDWVDLRARIDSPDRRCYAFFHPALVDEPLIFVEVALTREIPGAIAPILELKREPLDPERATTAVFYSISNCQRGLAGVTFGSFLIKQVVAEICREMPRLSTFVTLSPAPNFAGWLARQRTQPSPALTEADRAALATLDQQDWWSDEAALDEMREPMLRAAATYFMTARNSSGSPLDAVARFHLGNGARLERLNWPADLSERGRRQSCGLMVNYLYDLGDIEKNHEAYAESRAIIATSAIRKLARPSRALTTVEAAS
ncbi:MAG TPA: malonyl-CoA decarboxylase [Xanthobacteraceae bacterium]|jgi:malonyl-CoA decarboxylase|nr:malonyl-CoA decarboxylase [Xanthobacteraceae bacterium]